ncbi:hypothetical protein CLV48_101271 [Cecembia rubra]|uniref:Uncharacterized protein n=1 Tax=Cecembia rubra TaxID=1485585 RepID=A0A2P8ED03_9BACT|nr:hypothetical protein CLV48_101271 [Cecembia rubra]
MNESSYNNGSSIYLREERTPIVKEVPKNVNLSYNILI